MHKKLLSTIYKNKGATLDEKLNIKNFKRGYMVSVQDNAIIDAENKKWLKIH